MRQTTPTEARAREERQRENMAKHANTMRLAELRRASGERRINVSERWMADIIRHIASLDGGEQLAESVHEAVAKELGDKSWLR